MDLILFNEAYRRTMVHEGGYANVKADKGGETYSGISRRFHPGWIGWEVIDEKKQKLGIIRNNTIFEELSAAVKTFYLHNYWNAVGGEAITDADLAFELFDTAVNCGIGSAAKFLQRALNILNNRQKYWPDLVVDGGIGAKTVGCLTKANLVGKASLLHTVFTVMRGAYYVDILERREDQEVFANAWFSRLWISAT